jgi:hypothetical protein
MRVFLTALTVAVAALVFGPLVEGQPSGAQAPLASAPTVNLTAEQRHVIKELVLKDLNVPRVGVQVPMTIGAAVPPGVTLQSFPPEIGRKVPQIKSHEFFVKDGRVVIVSPKDNTIADVID